MVIGKNSTVKKRPIEKTHGLEDGLFINTLVLHALVMGVLLFSEYYGTQLNLFIRYLAFIPPIYTAYSFGLRAGVFSAFFFVIMFLPDLSTSLQVSWSSFRSINLLGFDVLIFSAVFLAARFITAFRKEASLSRTVMEWGELFALITDLDEMIVFILSQAKELIASEDAFLILRNPLNAKWEIIDQNTRCEIPADNNDGNRLNLASWLINQDESVYLNNLGEYFSSIQQGTEAQDKADLRSLLMVVLRAKDGTKLGQLILVNKIQGDFWKENISEIHDLVIASERALEQAGLYARTDYSLARRVRQLAVIQRTARELNASLDIDDIVEKTLNCALEISDAEGGFVKVEMTGLPVTYHSKGRHDFEHFTSAGEERQQLLEIGEGSDLRISSSQMNSKISVVIRREDQIFGLLIVESTSPRIFRDSSRHVLSILADHTAIALENARLFQDIQVEQQRVNMVINILAEGVVTTDLLGHVITLNHSAVQLLGWSEEEAFGKDIREIFGYQTGDAEWGNFPLIVTISKRKSFMNYRMVIKPHQQKRKTLSVSVVPIPSSKGHPEGAVISLRDISDEIENEKLQNELIASISHELRAPLTNISAIVETMLSQMDGQSDQSIERYLKKLLGQTQRLADFADQFLEVYRIDTGKREFQLRPIPIFLVVDQIVGQWLGLTSRQIQIINSEDRSPWIWADEKAVETVLNNLIENAIKYSPEGSKIEIVVEEPKDGFVTCGVRDQGQGIAPEHMDKIFTRFYRVDGGDAQKIYGHGLGLYLAKSLVESMNGHIWVESEFGKGSYFAFCLQLMEINDEG